MVNDYERAMKLRGEGLSSVRIANIIGRPKGTIEGWVLQGKKPLEVLCPVPNRELTDYERGFLEGLIDGEGGFTVYRNKSKRNVTETSLTIYNTNISLLEKAQSIVGGRITQAYSPNPLSKKTCYRLHIGPNTLRWLLPKIRLVAKEKQRLLVIKILEIVSHRVGIRWVNENEKVERERELDEVIKQYKMEVRGLA